ncbi:hypothetical protein JCM10450v2_003084 [Rhodotorula kratochvilovae]
MADAEPAAELLVSPTSQALPLPSREALAATLAASTAPGNDEVPLDALSWAHLDALCSQSLRCCKVAEATWKEPLMTALHDLEALLTSRLLAALAESRVAEAEAVALEQERAARGTQAGGCARRDRFGLRGWLSATSAHASDGAAEPAEEDKREQRRARWRDAAMHLRPLETGDEPQLDRHIREGTFAEWTEVDELPKLAVLQLRVKAVETTLGAVKAGTAALGVSFVAEEWDGELLFGGDKMDLDDQDLKLVERHGGTFRLTSTPRELHRLERILELLSFAVISLKLEVHLLRDLACPHPPPEPEPAPRSASPPHDHALGDEDDQNDSDIPLPGAYRPDLSDVSAEDWQLPKRWRTRWSAAGAGSWLQLVLPHPDLGRRKSLRRTSTRYSTIKSPPPVAPDPPDSPSPSRNSSLHRPFNPVRDKAKGFGARLRKRASKDPSLELHKAATIETDTVAGEEKGWDFLGGFGLGFLAPSRSEKEPKAEQDIEEEKADEPLKPEPRRFEKVVQDLAEFILSVSPDVLYPPPHLLFRLRQQELLATEDSPDTSVDPRQHDEPSYGQPHRPPPLLPLQSNLSIGTEAFALGFATGAATPSSDLPPPSQPVVPASSAARIALHAKAGLASLLTNNSSLSGSFRHQAMQFLLQVVRTGESTHPPCDAPRWVTLAFYQHAAPTPDNPTVTDDSTLGGFVKQLVREREGICASCPTPNHEHSVVLMHQKARVQVSLAPLPSADDDAVELPDDLIASWTTCHVCRATTSPAPLTPAAGAFSLAKFLELLLYDANLVPLPDLCEHASKDRSALVRCFALGGSVVEFRLGTIALFELRLPTAVDPDVEVDELHAEDSLDAHPVEELKQEIAAFFASVHARLDNFEERLLPPAPASDAGDDELNLDEDEQHQHDRNASHKTVTGDEQDGTLKRRSGSSGADLTLGLLRQLRKIVHDVEADCVHAAETTAANRLNDARFFFESKGKAIQLRLVAWETKHAPALEAGSGPDVPVAPSYDEPEYFGAEVHVFPVGSSVLVRDGELSSLIALALSAAPFHDAIAASEAGDLRITTPTSISSSFSDAAYHRPSTHKPIPHEFLHPSTSSPSATSDTPPRSPLRHSIAQNDPDDPDAVFATPAEVEYLAKMRKPPRVASGSMFRHLVRKKSGETGSVTSSSAPSPLFDHGDFGEKRGSRLMPLSDSLLDDFLKTPDAPAPKPKQLRPIPSIISGLASKREAAHATPICDVQATGVSSPRTSVFTGTAAGTIRSIASSRFATSESGSSAASLAPSTDDEAEDGDAVPPLAASPASLSGSRLLGHRLDGFFSGWDSARSKVGRLSPVPGWHEVSGGMDGAPTEHIKFKFRQGSKTYRVTSYFEKRFQALRAKCGLSESLFIESLTRCTDLNPSGGKSSAIFLMTGDQRFMLKELVTKLGYSELDSLLSFAPKLLAYLMSPERPSLLAKIFGIYTVKIADSKTGKKRKVDLILMEHLFFSKTISRQFDLKGIASRVAKPKAGAEAKEGTGWDGDWLTGSLQNQLLIYPHSKTLLRDALTNDVQFLSENGGIDFSLLVGVDDTHSELVVGLIDTLGVFNTLKVLEHHTKTAVRLATASDSSSVTVLPPDDYAKRFLAAMERYFIAVPDKWTKPPGDAAIDPDPRLACPL